MKTILFIFSFLVIFLLPPKGMRSQEIRSDSSQNSEYDEEEEGEEMDDNPEGLARERFLKRAGPDGVINVKALMEAKKQLDETYGATEDAGLWTWEWLGPGNIGGRIRAILIMPSSPNTIFIGSVSGGIWKSTNGGSTWTAINDFLPNLAVTSFALDPTNNNIIYAATGEGFGNFDGLPGGGIFKSTNGGTTWAQIPSTNIEDMAYISRIAHHPDSTGVLYAVAHYDPGVYKSKDGGTTWKKILTPVTKPFDVKIHPTNPGKVMVGCRTEVFISNNYGVTWTELTTGAANKLPSNCGRSEISFCPSNASRIYISMDRDSGQVWRSNDGGVTWEKRCTGDKYLRDQGSYDNTIWVDPTNSNHIVVGGIDIWRSTDGGATLTKISDWHDYHNGGSANSAHCDQHIIVSDHGYNGTTNKRVYFGNDGGIQKTEDVTTVSLNSGWVNLCNTTLGISQFYAGAAAPDGSKILGGTQDNDKLRYKSSGIWSGTGGWFQAITGDGGYCAIDFNNTSVFYGEYTHLAIQKSTNGGDSYAWSHNGLTDAGDAYRSLFIAPFSMDPNNSNTLIAGGADIWRTTNNAANWSSIKPDIGQKPGSPYYYLCSAIDIRPGNSDVIWVGYNNGEVWKTTNGTAANPAWTRVDANGVGLPDRWVGDIAINPSNSNQVFITFLGYEPDNVWYTSDGGSTWLQRTGTAPFELPDLPVNTIRFHPGNTNWVYIGTDLGIFASEDKGQNWGYTMRYANNDGPCNVEVDELFWQGDEYLIAATHGRGMYRAKPLVTIYVDINAAAGGDGSQAHPFQTIAEALAIAGNGTTISIAAGTYSEAEILLYKRNNIITTGGNVIIN